MQMIPDKPVKVTAAVTVNFYKLGNFHEEHFVRLAETSWPTLGR